MRVYVINLVRRPDRRAHMLHRADELGLELEFIDAVDARAFGAERDSVRVAGTPFGRIADGDLACTLSHRKIWALMAQRGDTYAVVLEDDALLADDAARFVNDESWIPGDAKIVKLERYGRPTRELAVDRERREALGRSVMRFHTRNVGSAGYVMSREAAVEALEATRTISVPIDQILFNPLAKGIFGRLRPYVLEPALCEQDVPHLGSDIPRKAMTDIRQKLHAALMELSTVGRAVAQGVRVLWGRVTGRIVLSRLTFKG